MVSMAKDMGYSGGKGCGADDTVKEAIGLG
jgi:hypothetical protein